MTDFSQVFAQFKKEDPSIEYFGKILGKGAYGEVREVKLKNSVKIMAAKLLKKEKDEDAKEIIIAQDLRGYNIIKINKTESTVFDGGQYDLIIMEKAILRDLGKLIEFHYGHNLLKLINRQFFEYIGNNLLRFYAKQIIDGLETLKRQNFVHFDIKPENLLLTSNLNIKMSDFSLITIVNDGDLIKIPGGTMGFLTPEYYSKEKVSSEVARKQDYFAFGATLFFILYDENLLKYQKFDEHIWNADRIIDTLNLKIYKIRSSQTAEQDLIDFLISLIHPKPEERPKFETIYKNKWINQNKKEIEEIVNSNENDEEKIIMELQKSDFLIEKKQKMKIGKKFRFKRKRKNKFA